MDKTARRTGIWLVLAAIAIGLAAWAAMGASASPGVAPEATGELKIVKNLGGGWPDGAFVFTWSCTDNQSGQATFPDDFTGANYTTPQTYPLGTVCTVEETDGTLKVSDYNVTTHIEGTAGFQAINPRDVSIDNSTGTNTIQYMNELADAEGARLVVRKVGPALEFGFAISCTDETGEGFSLKGGTSTDWTFDFDGRDDTVTCTVIEEQLTGWTTTIEVTGADAWSTGVAGDYPATRFTFGPGDEVQATFTNAAGYLSVPPTGESPLPN